MVMTLETAAITALGTVTTALCAMAGVFYQRLIKAELTVAKLTAEVRKLDVELGIAKSLLALFRQCPRRAECPFSMHQQPPIAPQ